MHIQDVLKGIMDRDVNYKFMFQHLSSRTDDIQKFMNEIHYQICETYREAGQKLPKSRYFSDDVINALYQDPLCPKGFRCYLANMLAKHL